MADPYRDMIDEIHVMLVDSTREFVTEMADLLQFYDYKVTEVDTISAAMSILSKGKKKIDVMIINVHSPDRLSFQLLGQATALDIISLFVCDEHNELLAKKALGEGAHLYLKKPLDGEIVKYLRQFVLREKIQRKKMREGSEKNGDQIDVDDIDNNNIVGDNKEDDIDNNNIVGENEELSGEKKNLSNTKEKSNNIHEAKNDVISNGKYKLKRKRGRKNIKKITVEESQNSAINKHGRKSCAEWTENLHAKFMEAAQQLGEGRCYPKDILEMMNVPGLTRMQVASHLQKCRRNNWRAPKERKSIRPRSVQKKSSKGPQQRSNFKRFGTMPRLQTTIPNLHPSPDQTQRGPEFSFSTLNNSFFPRGESSIQQLYSPKLKVQPHYLNIGYPYNNPFLSFQNDDGSGLQQQHEPLLGILGSQGLRHPIIGNTNYRSNLAFNSGDHHTQSDYNLDLNVARGTAYPGTEIMFSTNIENATINDYNLNANADNATTYSGDSDIERPIFKKSK